jgi:hypothetical protein
MIAIDLFRVSFMAWVASACSLNLFSICCNLLWQESRQPLETVMEGKQGVVGGNQGSFAFLGVGLSVLLSYTNQCP